MERIRNSVWSTSSESSDDRPSVSYVYRYIYCRKRGSDFVECAQGRSGEYDEHECDCRYVVDMTPSSVICGHDHVHMGCGMLLIF